MVKGLNVACLLIAPLVVGACGPSKSGAKGPVRRAVEFPVAATDRGLDKSYSAIDRKLRLPGGNRAPMREQELPIYYEGGSNISGLQRD